MKRIYKIFLIWICFFQLVYADLATSTFQYTGDIQYFTVPVGVYNIIIDAYGAGSGTSAKELRDRKARRKAEPSNHG